MKLKTWHLFFVIVILFGCSFYVVNLKFDKFYRVNGINNDNRVLIEKYLDEDEQNYLIENQISIDSFIDYLKKDNFHLQNYQYYNNLKDSGRYSNNDQIIEIGNTLSTRLTYLFKDTATKQVKLLIENSLEQAFLNDEKFNFDYFEYYQCMKPLYDENDYTFIADTENYVIQLKALGYTTHDQLNTGFQQMCQSYNKNSLATLFTKELPTGTRIVLNPYEVDTLVDSTHYIGEYEPTGLILIQDIPRVRYAMYLQSDAYIALTQMYEAMLKEATDFLLLNAYQSFQTLNENKIGYTESQLGFTIEVTKAQTKYDSFKDTDVSKWLEKHAYEYGYILRYPNKKASITNKSYDPHFYRYVGIEAAKQIHDSSLSLEEYKQNKR